MAHLKQFGLAWLAVCVMGAALIFSFLPEPAYGQRVQVLPMKCYSVSELEGFLKNERDEAPVWVGKNSHGTTFVLVQSEDGSWTFYGRREGEACVFTGGIEGKVSFKGSPA
jgi:hypothetical protein